MQPTQILWLAATWVVYFTLHSLLAAAWAKAWVGRRLPAVMPYYRLLYNGLALVLLLPPLYMTFAPVGSPLWSWQGPMRWLVDALAVLAGVGFLWSSRYYDMTAFLGLKQWRHHTGPDADEFHISPAHRFVRHPWYFFGLLILWTREMNLPLLCSSLLITLYLVIGARLEEAKLIARYGDRYRRYRARVPALLPRPWAYLTRSQAAALIEET